MAKTKTGRGKTRFEASKEILFGDRKTLSSKFAFVSNFVFSALCITGVSVIASKASYDGKLKATDAAAGAAFGVFGYLQMSEIKRKSGPSYWWVEEVGSEKHRRSKK
jgi:hypothetical protein